jgi:predicted nicotinamide N-methyase
MPPLRDLVEEPVALRGQAVRILRPRDSEALLDEDAFERDEFLPYWAELWPSALVLARAVAARSLRGARTVELGCGLGLVSIAAAIAGARVLATDWADDALALTAENAARNGVSIECRRCDWADPEPVLERAPWDLVLASDVLYEHRNVELIAELLLRLLDRGEAWIADPRRSTAAGFPERMAPELEVRTTTARAGGVTVAIHRLRRRRG